MYVYECSQYQKYKTDIVELNILYHITYHFNQDSVFISVNDSVISDLTQTPSHQISNANIHLSDPWHSSADVIVSGLQISSSNSKQPDNGYNYLCDFNNRFSVIAGTWTPGSLCEVVSPWWYGSEAWMGEEDLSSLQWQNYKIEGFVYMLLHIFCQHTQFIYHLYPVVINHITGDGTAGISFRATGSLSKYTFVYSKEYQSVTSITKLLLA